MQIGAIFYSSTDGFRAAEWNRGYNEEAGTGGSGKYKSPSVRYGFIHFIFGPLWGS
jgi:hypothetical protein